jgi:hypothetical protein
MLPQLAQQLCGLGMLPQLAQQLCGLGRRRMLHGALAAAREK